MPPELNHIYQGNCTEVMKRWPAAFVDTIITDPPYGIGFMGKAWDTFDPRFVETKTKSYREGRSVDSDNGKKNRFASAAQKGGEYDRSIAANRKFQDWCCAWATEALRIAKPGAMMLVSGGTRTFHRMTAGLEDAGWQIRDCLMWLYGSGFPKSLDISKALDKRAGADREVVGYKRQGPRSMFDGGKPRPATLPAPLPATLWDGWGTALKPAWEPIILAMKPLDGTFVENAEKWGVAGLNVDGGRIAGSPRQTHKDGSYFTGNVGYEGGWQKTKLETPNGRWPANLLLDEEAAGMLDGVSGASVSQVRRLNGNETKPPINAFGDYKNRTEGGMSDSGGASRFFYVAKSSRAERNEGCEAMESRPAGGMEGRNDGSMGSITMNKNHHPTVKPLDLMKYLCNLTRTPTGGIVLDPFAGSGTTLWAAEFHNRPWLGIEMNPEYVAIAEARIARERSQMKMAI